MMAKLTRIGLLFGLALLLSTTLAFSSGHYSSADAAGVSWSIHSELDGTHTTSSTGTAQDATEKNRTTIQ